MSRRKRKKKGSSSDDGWITTFSDLMSLLLTFFILLYSMSSMSDDKFSAASQSVQQAFVGETSSQSILDRNNALLQENAEENLESGISSTDTIPPEILEMYEEALAFIEAEGLESEVALSGDQDGIYLDIQESILFDTGRAKISSSGEDTLEVITELLNLTNNDIIVEGYTDDVPIDTPQFPSNWELSLSRASSVVRYLSETRDVDPSRLSARGYGEYSPIVPNDSAENRAKNRRVNIVVVYEAEEAAK